LAEDAVVKVLLTDAVDVRAVASAGRTIPAVVRTALEDRGRICAAPGCDVTRRLEIDHVVPLADGGTTTLDNLQWLCGWHHRRKHQGAEVRAGPRP
jgi:5-methylcytosine-specific restriction endonuclease McrA